MPRYSRRPNIFSTGAVPGPAAVDISAIPSETRTAIRAALAERLAAGETRVAARYSVARQFRLTIVRVEAIELGGEGPLGESPPPHDARVRCPVCRWTATVSNSMALRFAQTGCPKCGGAVSRRKGRA